MASTGKMHAKWVECDGCKKWFHLQCAEVPKQLYDTLATFKSSLGVGLYWYCWDCNVNVKHLLEEVQVAKLNQIRVDRELEEVKKAVVDGLPELRREVRVMRGEYSQEITKKEVEIKKSFVDIMNEQKEKTEKEQLEGSVMNRITDTGQS